MTTRAAEGDDRPGARRPRTAGLLAVSAVVLLGVVAAAYWLGGIGASSTPTQLASEPAPARTTPAATPDPTSTPTPAQPATPTAEEQAEPDTPAVFEQLAQEVSEVRGLPVEEPLRAAVVTPQELADVVTELTVADLDPDEVDGDQALLASLRLIPADMDLGAFLESLYREQVLGLYSPDDATLYVATGDEDLSPLAEITAAHEVQHALQDQAFDLEALRDLPDVEFDASRALLALIEGDAVLTQGLWTAAYQSDDERQEAGAEAVQLPADVLDDAPDYLVASLAFPYEAGAEFVGTLVAEGGIEAVDAAFADPPTTTEQILHPDKYLAGEQARAVEVATSPGAGWQEAVTYTFGEFDLREMLADLGADTAAAAAAGWDGGLARTWQRDGEVATAAVLAFDSEADAGEACEALEAWYREAADGAGASPGEGLRGDRDWFALDCAPDTVSFGLGPTRALAVRLGGP